MRGSAALALLAFVALLTACAAPSASPPALSTPGASATPRPDVTSTETPPLALSPAAPAQVLLLTLRGVADGVPTPDRETWLIDAATGQRARRVVATFASGVREIPAGPPALSPDGRFLLWVEESGGPRGCDFTWVADLATGEGEAGFSAGPPPLEGEAADWACMVSFPAFSPDGSSLAYVADGRARSVMLKEEGSSPEPLLEFQPEPDMGELGVYRLGWSPDGRYLGWLGVVYQSEGVNWPLFAADVAAGQAREVAGAAAFAWGPEGRLYYLRLPEGEPGESPSPAEMADIFSLDPSAAAPSPSLEGQVSDGGALAPVLAVSGSAFYFVTSSDPARWSRDQVMAYDRQTGRTALLYQAPAGWYVEEMSLARTPYLP